MLPYITVRIGVPTPVGSGRWLVAANVVGSRDGIGSLKAVVYRVDTEGRSYEVPGDRNAAFYGHLELPGQGIHQVQVGVETIDGQAWERPLRVICDGCTGYGEQCSFDLNGHRVFIGRITVPHTVIDLDMVGYTEQASVLHSHGGSAEVHKLNQRIQQFFKTAISALDLPKDDEVPLQDTGDGAIVVLRDAEPAMRFAREVVRLTSHENSAAHLDAAKCQFRIGVATGDVTVHRQEMGGPFQIAGLPIIAAVRLQTVARPNEVLLDAHTYAALPESARDALGGPEEVQVKTGTYRFHRVRDLNLSPAGQVIALKSAPAASGGTSPRRMIMLLWEQLNPKERVTKLIVLCEMPPEYQPSTKLSTGERFDALLAWANEQGKLDRLKSELEFLIAAG